MKKIYTLVVIALSVVLFSCGKSTSRTPEEQLKAGTWTQTKYVHIYSNTSGSVSTSSYDMSGYNYTLSFGATQATAVEGSTTTTSDYKLVDDVTLNYEGYDWSISALTSTQLTFSRTRNWSDGTYDTYRYEYTRTSN